MGGRCRKILFKTSSFFHFLKISVLRTIFVLLLFQMTFGNHFVLFFSNFSSKKTVIAAACSLPVDSAFIILLFLIYPDSLLPSILFIANFSMVILALIGINSKISSMIIPALVWKCGILLFLLFLGCISVDAYQHVPTEFDTIIEAETKFNSSMKIWKDLSFKYPMLPFVAVACTIVLAIEARIFFSAWQKLCCPVIVNDESNLEKQPPSYTNCVNDSSGGNDLPSYEDAIRAARSTSTPSTSTMNHVIYTIPDMKKQKIIHLDV